MCLGTKVPRQQLYFYLGLIMNRLPIGKFEIIEHVHTLELTRHTNLYPEVSIMDIYRVLSGGHAMFAFAQRHGDKPWTNKNLAEVALLSASITTAKEIIDIWRVLFLTGKDSIDYSNGTTHDIWTDVTAMFDHQRWPVSRIVIRGTVSNDNLGYVYATLNNRLGITRDHAEACNIYHYGIASTIGYSLLLSFQPDLLRDALAYLSDLHVEPLRIVIQRNSGDAWNDVESIPFDKRDTARFNKAEFIKQIN